MSSSSAGRIIHLLMSLIVGMLCLREGPALADANGITGQIDYGCPCHGGGQKPKVTLTGPTLVAPSSTQFYQLVIAVAAGSRNDKGGGLDVGVSAGMLGVGIDEGLRLEQEELTQVAPRASGEDGTVVFSFEWIAPDAETMAVLTAWGVAADLNGASSGDYYSKGVLTISVCPDWDGDLYLDAGCGGDDCEDGDAYIYPGAAEVCNGKDDDCNTEVDEAGTRLWYLDSDGDGHGDEALTLEAGCEAPPGYAEVGDDCADTDASSYPGSMDACGDGLDADCDGEDPVCPTPTPTEEPPTPTVGPTATPTMTPTSTPPGGPTPTLAPTSTVEPTEVTTPTRTPKPLEGTTAPGETATPLADTSVPEGESREGCGCGGQHRGNGLWSLLVLCGLIAGRHRREGKGG